MRKCGRASRFTTNQPTARPRFGVSVFHPRGHRAASAQDVIRRADEALYRSKREGRARLTIDSLSLVVAKEGDRRIEKPPPRN